MFITRLRIRGAIMIFLKVILVYIIYDILSNVYLWISKLTIIKTSRVYGEG